MPRRRKPITPEQAARREAKRAAALAEAQRLQDEAAKREADYREAQAEKIAPALLRNAVKGHTAASRSTKANRKRIAAGLDPEPAELRPALLAAAQWHDPDRAGTVVSSFRASSAIWGLYTHSRHITRHHVKAARQFLDDFQIANGASPAKSGASERIDNPDNGGTVDRQFAAIARNDAARAALGEYEPIVSAVVLLDWGRERIARWLAIRDSDATAAISAAMDRLCGHYWPEAPTRAATAPLGPIALPDAGNVPLVQIARWRQPTGRETGIAIGG
jgi:hypothetical protein